MIAEILRSYALTLEYLRRLIADVPDDQLTCQPGGVANHPAWVIGHLTYSCQAIGEELGLAPWLPADWASRFGTRSVPVETRATYPPKGELLAALADGQQRVEEGLVTLGEEGIRRPLPDVRYRTTFPTIGDAALHVLTAHAAVHVGQVSAWRRAAGFPALREPFL
jgi:DinB superfamily